MSDHTPSAGTPQPRPRARSRARGAAILAAIALVSAFAGAAASKAFTHGWGHGFRHGPGLMWLGGPVDPAKAEMHAERAARHFAVEVDATKAQEQKLIDIAKATVKDLLPLRETVQAARARGLDLLSAPSVDRAAIEALRAEQMANADAFTKRIAQTIADAAEILTPEQRKSLAERIKEFRERHGWLHGPRRG